MFNTGFRTGYLIFFLFFIFNLGVVFTQPPPDFVDEHSDSESYSNQYRIQKLDIGFGYQNASVNYEGNDYSIDTYSVPDFYYEAERNLINSKRMNLKFNSGFYHYDYRNDYFSYDDEYLKLDILAHVKKYVTDKFLGIGFHTYHQIAAEYIHSTMDLDFMIGYDAQNEYISLLTPDKTYREGFYSEILLRKNIYYNDSEWDPSTLHIAAGYAWADGSYNYVNCICAKMEIPVGDDDYSRLFISNDYRIDFTQNLNAGLYLDLEYTSNSYASQTIFNLKPAMTYYFDKIYLQMFYNFENFNSDYNKRDTGTIGLRVAYFWQK
jgi:hypothetical protein